MLPCIAPLSCSAVANGPHRCLTLRLCLQANYGKSSKEAVAAVKALYRDLKLEQAFFDYEQASHERLSATIAEQTLLPKQVVIPYLNSKAECFTGPSSNRHNHLVVVSRYHRLAHNPLWPQRAAGILAHALV